MRGSRRGLVYASVQRGEVARSAVDQHWAQGVVMAPDLVLVPDPPEAEDEVLSGLHLLVTAPGGGEWHRVAVRGLELLSLEGRGVCAAVLLAGAVPAPRRPTQPSTPDPLIKALDSEGTIWPALRALVPDGSGPGSDPALFLDHIPGGLPDVPVVRGPRRTDLPTVEEVGKSLCWFVPWCQPVPPGRPR